MSARERGGVFVLESASHELHLMSYGLIAGSRVSRCTEYLRNRPFSSPERLGHLPDEENLMLSMRSTGSQALPWLLEVSASRQRATEHIL